MRRFVEDVVIGNEDYYLHTDDYGTLTEGGERAHSHIWIHTERCGQVKDRRVGRHRITTSLSQDNHADSGHAHCPERSHP